MQDWSRCKRVQLPLVLITVVLHGYNNYNRQQCAYFKPTTITIESCPRIIKRLCGSRIIIIKCLMKNDIH